MRFISIFLPLFILLLSHPGISQEAPNKLKWGKVSKKLLKMTEYKSEPDAPALVLGDFQEIHFDIIDEIGIYVYNRHVQIKILNEEGLKYAQVAIPFEHWLGIDEPTGFKGQLIKKDGSKEKLSRSEFNMSVANRYFSELQFEFKDAEVGDIIEYKYTIRSMQTRFIKEFFFESEIPALSRELFFEYPKDFYEYTVVAKPSFNPHKSDNLSYSKSYNIREEVIRYGLIGFISWSGRGTSNREPASFDLRMQGYYYQFINIPSSPSISAVTCMKDNYESVWFRRHLNLNRGAWEPDLYLWFDLAQDISSLDFFGGEYRGAKNAKDILGRNADRWKKRQRNREKIIPDVFALVKERLDWDGKYFWNPNPSVSNCLQKASGNSAAINLALINCLRHLDFEAWPALVSTRSNGRMFLDFPNRYQFNHVICYVKLSDDEYMLLDATSPIFSPETLPFETQNHFVWLAHPRKPEWLPLEPKESRVDVLIDAQLDANGQLSGYSKMNFKGNSGYRASLALNRPDSTAFIESVTSALFEKKNIDSLKLTRSEVNSDVSLSFLFNPTLSGSPEGGFSLNPVMINPGLILPKLNNRKEPINIDIPSMPKLNYVIKIQLNEQMEWENLPKSQVIHMEGGGIKCAVTCAVDGNIMQYILNIDYSESVFSEDRYHSVRAFIAGVNDKLSQRVLAIQAGSN